MSKGWKLPQTRLLKQYKIFSLLQKLEVQVAQLVENPPGNAGDTGDGGLIPGSGKVLGGGNGNPFHYSCLGNPMDRGAWWAATAHWVAKERLNNDNKNNKSYSLSEFKLKTTNFHTLLKQIRVLESIQQRDCQIRC